jgi:hypothetical protein
MRSFMLTLGIVVGLLMIPAAYAESPSTSALAFGVVALEAHGLEAGQPPQINIEIKESGGGRAWYASPMWIAIGILAFLVVVVLIVMAAKGGGTTVVKG